MKKGYSLLELSIIVIITGILISGVVAGSGMVRSTRIINARSLTAKSPATEVNGLLAWYESSMIESFNTNQLINNAILTNWYDLTPNSNSNVSGAVRRNQLLVSGSRITFVTSGINDIPSAQFATAGAGNFSILNSGASNNFYQGNSSTNTIFLVIRPAAITSATETIIDSGPSSAQSSSISITNNSIILDAGTVRSIATTFSSGADYIISAYFNPTSSQVFINNAQTPVGSGNSGSNQLSGLTVGSNRNNSNNFRGFISEIIIYNRSLKVQERRDVMNYLSKKYKIAVSGL